MLVTCSCGMEKVLKCKLGFYVKPLKIHNIRTTHISISLMTFNDNNVRLQNSHLLRLGQFITLRHYKNMSFVQSTSQSSVPLQGDSAAYTPIRADECQPLRSPSFNVTGVIPPAIRRKEPLSYSFRMSSEETKLLLFRSGFSMVVRRMPEQSPERAIARLLYQLIWFGLVLGCNIVIVY